MINSELFLRFGSAILIGILIGLQREYAYGAKNHTGLVAGARTYGLMALFGASGALLADGLASPWVFSVVVVLVGVMVVVAYFITASERDEIGMTSEVAALLTVLIGGICYYHSIEVILPVLPNRTFGPPPLDVLNPYQIWEMVVFISGINFLGYILIKIVGPRKGLGISGILGGLASSTATTMSFSQRSKAQNELDRPFAVAIITSWVIMFVRIVLEVAVVNRQLLPLIWPAMSAMGGAGLLYALYLYYSQAAMDEEEMQLSNPFELGPALKFGLIYALVLLIVKAAELYIGEKGIFLTSFVAGLADVDAITLSISDLTRSGGSIPLTIGKAGIILAAISNTATKGALVFFLGSKTLGLRVLPAFVLILLIGLGFIVLF